MAELFPFMDVAGAFEARFWQAISHERGVVHILHGMAEHSARYEEVAEILALRGFSVYAHNHPGHGAQAVDLLGHFGDERGWEFVLQRVAEVRAWIQGRHPKQPHIILGHSMGSFIALAYLASKAEPLASLWLSGSTFPNLVEVWGGRLAARFEAIRQGKCGKSWLLEKLSFSSYNNAFSPARTPFDWLSRDPRAVDLYIADPLCGFRCTNQLWVDLLDGLWDLFAKGGLSRLPSELPILLMSGSKDPVGGTKGVARLERGLKKAGLRMVQAKLFADCRHELFHELTRLEVFGFLQEQLEACLLPRTGAMASGETIARS